MTTTFTYRIFRKSVIVRLTIHTVYTINWQLCKSSRRRSSFDFFISVSPSDRDLHPSGVWSCLAVGICDRCWQYDRSCHKNDNAHQMLKLTWNFVIICPFCSQLKHKMSTLLLVLLDLFLENSVTSTNFFGSSCNLFSNDDNRSGWQIAATIAGGVTEAIWWVFGTASSVKLVDCCRYLCASPSFADIYACCKFPWLPVNCSASSVVYPMIFVDIISDNVP